LKYLKDGDYKNGVNDVDEKNYMASWDPKYCLAEISFNFWETGDLGPPIQALLSLHGFTWD
jgi:hypothetical protein